MIHNPTRQSDIPIVLCLLLSALVLFCLDLDGVPLRDWDEGTVALVAREISRSDSWQGWIFPQLWGSPYFNKPPLLHGLIAAAYRLWGVHAWTTRLPGAILTASSVPLLFAIGRSLFSGRLPALTGALVYLTLLPVVRHGRLAMLDGAVVCFFMVTLGLLLRATGGAAAPKRFLTLESLGVGIGFSLMCLTKGLLGVLLLAVALAFIFWDRPAQFFSPHLWGGLLVGALPATAWYLLQWLHYGPQFWGIAVLDQGIDRVWQAVEQNQGPPWYYLLEILKYSWPWLIVWPTGFWLAWCCRQHSWAKLLLVWTIGYLAVISVMGTKLPWYGFPAYPAFALTCGVALAAAWNMHRHWNGRTLSLKRLPKVWAVLLALLSLLGLGGVFYASPWGGEPAVLLLLTFLGVAATTGLAALFVARQQTRFLPTLVAGIYLSLLCLVASDHWLWELGEDFSVLPVAALVQRHTPPGQVVYTAHPHERPSLNFYSDRRVLPQLPQELQARWQTTQPTYLLVTDPAPYLSATELGTADGWHLLVNQR